MRSVAPIRRAVLAAAICLLLHPAVCHPREKALEANERPRIGLALSGGGARGLAHIGVLKVLEEHRIPVDFIAGTSMGAIVGGLYASGLSADELETSLGGMDWNRLFEDESARRHRAFRRKVEEQRYLMGFEVGFSQGRLVFPPGVRSGRKLLFELRRLTLPTAGIENFDDLPIPFTAVATDIGSGEMILLQQGDLPLSMLASSSLPGILAPVNIDGRKLVDGGLVRNIPTDIVRRMGADVVITVDIGSQLLPAEELKSILGITSQGMDIVSLEANKAMREAADILITPQVNAWHTLDFTATASIISQGADDAHAVLGDLAGLSVTTEAYARHRARRQPPVRGPMAIVSTTIEGLERIDERTIRSRVHLEPGTDLDIARLERDLDLIFGLGDFEFIDYRLTSTDAGVGVVIMVREKPWAPNYLHGAVRITIDDDENTAFDLLANLTVRPINRLNAEWRTDMMVGSHQRLNTEFYQPVDYAGRFFVGTSLETSRLVYNFLVDEGRTTTFELRSLVGQVFAGFTLGTTGEFRLGLGRGRYDYTLDGSSFPSGFPEAVDLGGWSSTLVLDTLNSVYFPREGGLFAGSFFSSLPSLGASDRYDTMGINGVYAKSWGRHTAISWLEAGVGRGDEVPGYAWFPLGGLFSLSAYEEGELSGKCYGVLRPIYLYRIAQLPSVLGKGVYLGGWIEAGNVWDDSGEIAVDDLRFTTTLTLGAETIVGPFYLAHSMAEEGRSRWYLSIGASFGGSQPGN